METDPHLNGIPSLKEQLGTMLIPRLMCFVVACSAAILQPVAALSQATPAPYFYQVEAACGAGTVRTFYDNGKQIDAYDTAGDNAEVVRLTRSSIVKATLCLDSLPATAPSSVRVYLRDVILGSLGFEMSALRTSTTIQQATDLLQSEARIAVDQCHEPDLMQQQEPYTNAQALVGYAIDRAAKMYAYRNTPLDYYKADYRVCAARIGKAVSF